jgi:hypothetical protein
MMAQYRPRTRRRLQGGRSARSPALGLLAAPAALMLAAAPVSATLPGAFWLPICGADGTHWLLLPEDPFRPGDSHPRDHGAGLCAHATCPGEQRPGGKARSRP